MRKRAKYVHEGQLAPNRKALLYKQVCTSFITAERNLTLYRRLHMVNLSTVATLSAEYHTYMTRTAIDSTPRRMMRRKLISHATKLLNHIHMRKFTSTIF